MVTAHFRGIRKVILKEIALAQKKIDVAVYWFTNHDLLDALIDSIEDRQVTVRLIVHNDYINNRVKGPDFQRFIDCGGEFYFSPPHNTMHNKFCILDNKVLINGSYNWTYFAESKNYENVLVLREENDVINEFATEFTELIGDIEPQSKIKPDSKERTEKV